MFFKLNLSTGKWATYSLIKNKLKYDDFGAPVKQLLLDSGHVHLKNISFKFLEEAFRGLSSNSVKRPRGIRTSNLTGYKKLYSFNETITSSTAGDLNGDHKNEIILAGINGKVDAKSQSSMQAYVI